MAKRKEAVQMERGPVKNHQARIYHSGWPGTPGMYVGRIWKGDGSGQLAYVDAPTPVECFGKLAGLAEQLAQNHGAIDLWKHGNERAATISGLPF